MAKKLSESQQGQVREFVRTLIEDLDTAPDVWHFHYAPLVWQVNIHIFYTENTFQQVRESGEYEQTWKHLRRTIKDEFDFMDDQTVMVVIDSLAKVEQMGGWLGYYK